jgi:hypothetical protein
MVFAATSGYTDYVQDPTATVALGLVIFFLVRGLFVDVDQQVFLSTEDALSSKKETRKNSWGGWCNLFLMALFLAAQLLWIGYRQSLGTISETDPPTVTNPDGYLYPRDVFALFVSITSFCYIVIVALTLAFGHLMAERASGGDWLVDYRLLLHYFQNMFWFVFFLGTSALQYTATQSTANSSTPYNSVTTTNLENASLLVLLSGIFLTMYKYVRALANCNPAFDDQPSEMGKYRTSAKSGVMEKTAYWPLVFPCEETSPLFMVASLLYTLATLLLIYVDYVKFEVAGSFVVLSAVLFTLFSKNLDTFQFHFMLSMFFITTVAYIVMYAVPGNGPFPMDGYTNDGVNCNPLTVNPSTINTPADFQLTYVVTSATSVIASGYLFLGSTMHYCNRCAKIEWNAARPE